jgi:hypothetical protein
MSAGAHEPDDLGAFCCHNPCTLQGIMAVFFGKMCSGIPPLRDV